MDIWLILAVGLAPGLFWLWYFYSQDKIEPEPLSLVAKLFFPGMAAAGMGERKGGEGMGYTPLLTLQIRREITE